MTSAINSSAINVSYPVAGVDNNSQGFRNNFTAIQAGLAVAKSEISALQQNSVLVRDVATSSVAVVNNLLGSTISNGLYSQFNGVVYSLSNVGSAGAAINIGNGPMQSAILTANATLNFTSWPTTGKYSVIKLMLIGDQSSKYTVTLTNPTGGSGKLKLATTPTLTTVAITGTGGQFSCNASSLSVGQLISISGTNSGTGSITGYSSTAGSPVTYYIIATNGSTTFTLSTTRGGAAIATTVGTPIGLTYTASALVGGPSASTAFITLDRENHFEMLEAWTIDGGTTVYLKLDAQYTAG
jgi:hypothetical protein